VLWVSLQLRLATNLDRDVIPVESGLVLSLGYDATLTNGGALDDYFGNGCVVAICVATLGELVVGVFNDRRIRWS